MGERTSYAPGTFCWADLTTTDAARAKAFYGELFGWEAEDMPAGEAGTYTMLRLDGRDVCGLAERADATPAWLSYVSVEDVDARSARAGELGATVLQEPFDVLDAGRMALVQDPTGAVLALWQPRRHPGAALVNDPGAMCLNQLNTPEPEVAQRFYGELFGWRIEPVGTDEQPYWGVYNGGALNGGMMALPAGAEAPPHWLVYFTTPDLDAAAQAIGRLGGRVVVAPMAVPGGRIAVAQDPQGAAFALFEGDVDP